MTPDREDLWFLPLGGCGEIGMNFNLYGHDGEWLIVDCGLSFSKQTSNGDDTATTRHGICMADPAFIAARKETISGMVITHAHEDHIGAVPYLWPKLQCPVYTTAFTAHVLRRKLAEANLLDDVPIIVVNAGEQRHIGAFRVEWVEMTHSVPHSFALFISTEAGSVLHSGDWKWESQPVIGEPCNTMRLKQIGQQDITAMISDSTNADVNGSTPTEAELEAGLTQLVGKAEGRVVVTLFGSNLARVKTLTKVANATGRHIGMLGRSMINMVSAGKATGLLPLNTDIVEAHHLGYLPPESVLLLATGSQGEPRAALSRMSHNAYKHLELQSGDTVIFSSRVIPGNEAAINALIERLELLDVKVLHENNTPELIHASGHPARDDLHRIYDIIQPQLVIPVHGEPHHLKSNAEVAKRAGVRRQITGKNGDLFIISPNKAIRRGAVAAGELTISGKKLVPAKES